MKKVEIHEFADQFDRFLSAEGVRAHYVECGTGPETLVLLPSPLIGLRSYRSTIRLLGGMYRVIAIELPGSGRSDRVKNPWSNERYANWLATAFEVLAIKSAVVIGHSNSGAMALWLGAKYSTLVSKLVLVDSVGAMPDRSAIKFLFWRAATAVREPRFTFVAMFDLVANLIRHSRTFFRQLFAGSRANLLAVAAAVRVPVLLTWGGKDRTMSLKAMQRLRSVLPQAAVVVNEKGDHDWIAARPADFRETIRLFVRRETKIPTVRYRRA